MHRRRLDWSAALRDLKSDRLTRHPIREEFVRSAAGFRGAPALALSAWRGRSGRRYVVSVHPLDAVLDEPDPAVVIAAHRGDIGSAIPVSIAAFEAGLPDFAVFRHVARAAGATELHVHHLAETAAERAAIVADLTEMAVTAA